MNQLQKILYVGAGILALAGCEKLDGLIYITKPKASPTISPAPNIEKAREDKAPKMTDYFAELNIKKTNMNSADYDMDGDVDYIVSGEEENEFFGTRTRYYFFENDGKGNFTLKKYLKN